MVPRHSHSREDLHDLTSAINPGAPVPMPQMYYAPFPAQTLSMPAINYQYPVSEGSMDLTYMFAAASANTTLPQNLLLEGTGSGTMQNRHPSVMSCTSPTAPPTRVAPPSLHQSPVQTSAYSPKITSFPTSMHEHTILPPAIHPGSGDQTFKFGVDVR